MTTPLPGPDARHADVAVIEVDLDGRIRKVSAGARGLLGHEPADLIGYELTSIIPERFRAPHLAGFERVRRTGGLTLEGKPLRLPAKHADGHEVDVELVLTRTSPDDSPGIIGLLRGITTTSAQAALATRIQEAVAADLALPEVLRVATEPIARELGWRLAVVWIVDPWIERLRAEYVWEENPGKHPTFVEATRASRFGRGDGMPGMVWDTATAVWSSDLPNEPRFTRSKEAGIDSLRSGLFFPLLAANGPVGVVELLDDEVRGVDAETHEAVWALSHELGGHMAERLRRETEVTQRGRLQLALTAGRMGMWTYHIPTGQVTWDEWLERNHGIEPGSFGGTFEAFIERIHPDDRADALAVIGTALEERRRFDIRYRAVAADGSTRWIDGAGAPMVDQLGEVQGMTGVGLDITQRVADEALLQRRAAHAALAADVGRALVSDDPFDDRLQRVASAVVQHLDGVLARIWVTDAATGGLAMRANAHGAAPCAAPPDEVLVGEATIRDITATRTAHLVNDLTVDPLTGDDSWVRQEGIRSFIGCPLVVRDRSVGVMAFFTRHELAPDASSTLASIADTIAIAIQQDEAAAQVLWLLDETDRQREAAERSLIERQHVAEVLQASLLPPELPDIDGLDVAAAYRSGVEDVGGDFYDVFPLGAQRWALMIGDICGRGPEAARLTALSRHTLRTALLLGQAPPAALSALDQALRMADNDGRFCTAVCGVMEIGETIELRLSVAGHPAPIIVGRDGSTHDVTARGPLVGVLPEVHFDEHRFRLADGETLVLYTDGVIEARRDGELFGIDRLREVVSAHSASTAADLTKAIVDRVSAFDCMATKDDLAVVTLRAAFGSGETSEP